MSTLASHPLIHTRADRPRARERASLARSVLLGCGIVATLLWIATDVVAAMRWEGYRSASQTISELTAIDAPTRPFVVPLIMGFELLVIAFGMGVWASARGRAQRVTACSLFGVAAVGLVATPFCPMHLRGAAPTLTDAMHVATGSVTVLLLFVAIGFGAAAGGRWFRRYSIVTLLIALGFGTLMAFDSPRIARQEPTPWIGVNERISVYACMVWMLVFAVMLLGASRRAARDARR